MKRREDELHVAHDEDRIGRLEELCRINGLGLVTMRQVTDTGVVEMRQVIEPPDESDRGARPSDP